MFFFQFFSVLNLVFIVLMGVAIDRRAPTRLIGGMMEKTRSVNSLPDFHLKSVRLVNL